MTQDELAAKSSVDQTYISSIETGRRVPSVEIRGRLAKALGVAPSKLQFPEPQPDATVDRSGDSPGHSAADNAAVPHAR